MAEGAEGAALGAVGFRPQFVDPGSAGDEGLDAYDLVSFRIFLFQNFRDPQKFYRLQKKIAS